MWVSENQKDQNKPVPSGASFKRASASSLDKVRKDGLEYGFFIREPQMQRQGPEKSVGDALNSAVRPQSKLVQTYKEP